MERIEYLNTQLFKILEEIKKLEEINDENKKKIEYLKDVYIKLDKELNEKISIATICNSVDNFMEKRIVEEPLIASLIFSVDDNGESDQIKDNGSKWCH